MAEHCPRCGDQLQMTTAGATCLSCGMRRPPATPSQTVGHTEDPQRVSLESLERPWAEIQANYSKLYNALTLAARRFELLANSAGQQVADPEVGAREARLTLKEVGALGPKPDHHPDCALLQPVKTRFLGHDARGRGSYELLDAYPKCTCGRDA